MTKKEFLNKINKDEENILQQFLDLLEATNIDYCVIGGLAVNAYVEPVVSLDLDIVISASLLDNFIKECKKIFKVEDFPHSVNLHRQKSDLRIQIQKDPRYQDFILNATEKDLLGYPMKVASLEDVMQGKIWAYSDENRRRSKRQKDLADIFRIIETYPALKKLLPGDICSLI